MAPLRCRSQFLVPRRLVCCLRCGQEHYALPSPDSDPASTVDSIFQRLEAGLTPAVQLFLKVWRKSDAYEDELCRLLHGSPNPIKTLAEARRRSFKVVR